MSKAEEIARFYGQGKEAENGVGFVTLCPVHGDKNPSLSVRDDGKGGVDVMCHTGCNFKDIKDRFVADVYCRNGSHRSIKTMRHRPGRKKNHQ